MKEGSGREERGEGDLRWLPEESSGFSKGRGWHQPGQCPEAVAENPPGASNPVNRVRFIGHKGIQY